METKTELQQKDPGESRVVFVFGWKLSVTQHPENNVVKHVLAQPVRAHVISFLDILDDRGVMLLIRDREERRRIRRYWLRFTRRTIERRKWWSTMLEIAYHVNGKLHRSSGPAITILVNGVVHSRSWFHNDQHRNGGDHGWSAIIEGVKVWKTKSSYMFRNRIAHLHRNDGGPAWIHPDGRIRFYHRDNMVDRGRTTEYGGVTYDIVIEGLSCEFEYAPRVDGAGAPSTL